MIKFLTILGFQGLDILWDYLVEQLRLYDGCYLGTMDPGTFFGPVEEWVHANQYLTVLVSGWWISVYDERNGTWFADRVVVQDHCKYGSSFREGISL